MLSRLISLLSRIPAVKWAFSRLKPSPRGGSIDGAPIAASITSVADIAEAAPSLDASADIPVAEDSTPVAVIAEAPSAAPVETSSDEPSLETPADVEPVAIEAVAISPVESETAEAPERVSNDPPEELQANVQPVVAEETPLPPVESEPIEAPEPVGSASPEDFRAEIEPLADEEAQIASVDAGRLPVDDPEPIVSSDPSPELPADIVPEVAQEAPISSTEVETPPVVNLDLIDNDDHVFEAVVGELDAIADTDAISTDLAPVAVVEADSTAAEIAEIVVADDQAAGVTVDVVPVAEEEPLPAVAIIAEEVPVASSESSPGSEPVLVVLPSPPKRNRAPRTPTRAVDPADRATLIRQRWEQTGIRMWNPRIHGTGDATLNIQGRIELLPPESGNTMPRYDRLEFRLFGGQIVCEGVIVEAPASVGHRSFTQLAEPGKPAPEPVRERRAALA